MGIPLLGATDWSNVNAAILGIPFDCGDHPCRVGARLGPGAIRDQSVLVRPFRSGFEYDNPIERLGLVDAGDVECRSGDVTTTFPAIERTVSELLVNGVTPVTMGGDGAVTLPQLRAVSTQHPDLIVLHIDSHTDAYPIEGYNNTTTFTRAAEEGVVAPRNSFHLGARGNTFIPAALRHAVNLGYNVVTYDQWKEEGVTAVLKRIASEIGNRPVYLCFDMDIFDPSCAPGVCTPEWGGLLAEEGLRTLRALSGLNFVAFDVNTVSPPHDSGGMTALLAATVMYECCALATMSMRI